MKLLITGAGGQLGQELLAAARQMPFDVIGYARAELDIADMDQVQAAFSHVRPDFIIHAAAYTAVDDAETNQEKAYQINAYGARNVAVAAEQMGAKLCYISTDYVFDGEAAMPYREFDRLNPLNVYGKSKQAGEQLVQTLSSRYFIVRTSWLFGQHGNNFVKTMLRLAQEKEQLQVVNDQIGSPTYAKDLAHFLLELITTDKYGIYHATNAGACSWFEFAREIFQLSGDEVEVLPCATEEFPRPARRPKHSVLDNMAMRTNGFQQLRHWRDALQEFICLLGEDSRC